MASRPLAWAPAAAGRPAASRRAAAPAAPRGLRRGGVPAAPTSKLKFLRPVRAAGGGKGFGDGNSKGGAPPPKPDDEAAVRRRVDRASALIDAMMGEVSEELFVAEGEAYVTGKPPEVTQREAVAKAVEKRFDDLDEDFLMVLGGYIDATATPDQEGAHSLLVCLRDAVVEGVTKMLPTALQLLDELARTPSPAERKELLRVASTGGGTGVPECDAKDVVNAADELIRGMEDADEVPDRRLLARLCLIRENARDLIVQGGSGGMAALANMYPSSVTQLEVVFFKEVLRVSDRKKRQALLAKAFSEDWVDAVPAGVRAAIKVAPPPAPPPGRELLGGGSPPPPEPGAGPGNEVVRPGRLLNCVMAVGAEMQQEKGAGPGVSERIEQVREDACLVLEALSSS